MAPVVLPERLEQIARVLVAKGGTIVQGRQQINLIEGTYTTLTITDSATNERVDITIELNATAAAELIQDTIGALASGGSGLTMSYNDGANTWVLDVGAGHGIDVTADAVDVDETELDHALIGGTDPAIAKTLLTTRGDTIYRDASAPARLAVGTANQVLKSDGTDPGWGTVGVSSMATPTQVRLRRAANQSINTASVTAVSWDTEDNDADGFIAVTASTLTVPTGLGGVYAITFGWTFASVIGTRHFGRIVAGGRTWEGGNLGDNAGLMTPVVRLTAADTIVCSVFQQSGGAVNVTAILEAFRLAP